MLSLSTNAVAAKARSIYGGRLKQEDYEELLKKRTVGEVAAYLRQSTPYKEVLAEVRENAIHRGQLEHLLRKDFFFRCQRLARYAGGKQQEFYRFCVRKDEIDVILNRIRMLNSELYEEFAGDLPLYLEKYVRFDLLKLMKCNNFDELLSVLEHTGYDEVLKPFKPVNAKQKINYVGCERALNQYYYSWLFETIKKSFSGKTRKELLTIFESEVELANISKIYRYKKFFETDAKEILSSLTQTNQRMSANFLRRLAEAKDDQELLRILANSSYHMLVDDAEYVFIEYYADKIKYHLSHRYMRFSTSAPLVFTTFVVTQNLEIENLINIIEGVRYGVPAESIEKMLIY